MEVLMRVVAIKKIRMDGARPRERNATTSLALKREPRTRWRRSKESLIRLRKRRTRRRRKTTRLRLKRAKTTMLLAIGTWGALIPSSTTVVATKRRRTTPMMTRLRLRRSRSSAVIISLPPRHGEKWGGLPRGLVPARRNKGEEAGDGRVLSGLGLAPDPDIVELVGREGGDGNEPDVPECGQGALGLRPGLRDVGGGLLPF